MLRRLKRKFDYALDDIRHAKTLHQIGEALEVPNLTALFKRNEEAVIATEDVSEGTLSLSYVPLEKNNRVGFNLDLNLDGNLVSLTFTFDHCARWPFGFSRHSWGYMAGVEKDLLPRITNPAIQNVVIAATSKKSEFGF